MPLSQLTVKKRSAKSEADSTLLMLLSLNFLLLSFFILLNSLSTHEAAHAKNVLARVREGYNVQGPMDAQRGVAPVVAITPWQAPLAARVQGLVLNRLNLQTIPLETDADRLVMEIPLAMLFDGPRLRDPQFVRNIMAAGGREALVRWEILGRWQDQTLLAAQATALAVETDRVAVSSGNNMLRVTFVPAPATDPDVASTLQSLGIDAGATRVEGVGQ